MSIRSLASILILFSVIFGSVKPENVVRSYTIQKDFFNVAKAGEFSVFDPSEKELQYRIESKFTFMQSVELVAYPSKQVVGKLDKKFKLFLYKGAISILDPRSNKWIDGEIHEKFMGYFLIEWNGQRIKMQTSYAFFTAEFRDENDNTLLAQYDKKLISMVWANKYELKIMSDKLPDAIYLLALAARDHVATQAAKNSKGKRKYSNY